MNVFLLFAHPEPEKSYNKAILDIAQSELTALGHHVRTSDLYQMQFNPVASKADFKQRRFPDRLQYDREQKFSVANSCFSDDIQQEIDKVLWCDTFIIIFPLYWFSMPAIMKGWFDRVFVNSLIYGAGRRFEDGGLKGKKAMVVTSTGGFEHMFKADALMGDFDAILWPIHGGIFTYTGMDILPPFVTWAPAYASEEQLEARMEEFKTHIRKLDTFDTLPAQKMSDFDENYQLKAGIALNTWGHPITPKTP